MRAVQAVVWFVVACLCLVGCQTKSLLQEPPTASVGWRDPSPPNPTPPPSQPQPRKRTPEQVQLLQDFAMKESPKIWQTIQTMRAEMSSSAAKIKNLREELKLFDRNPESDEDYKALVAGLQELRHAYDAIFDKLADAYIAAKKYEASPSRKDYQDTMKRALEDGINDADMATERYKVMTRQK